MSQKRVMEILRVVDEFLRRLNRWMNDPQGGPVIPEDVRLALQSAAMTCATGSVPESCRDLAVIAIPRLMEEFRGYNQREYGKVRPESGAPGPSFWAAAKAVAIARVGADEPVVERLEPVHVLVAQGVTYDQIARHIYGRRGEGPFLQANGAPDVALIEQEANEPGSVIPADWIPPWHQKSVEERRQELLAKMSAYDRLQTGQKYDDPATVEELLREGAFIQQIERAKGVTRDDVLTVARRIGIKPQDAPGYHPGVRDSSGVEWDEDSESDSAANRQAVRSLIIELHTKSNGTKTAAEIATELRQLGHDIQSNNVAATITHWKKRHPSEEASAA